MTASLTGPTICGLYGAFEEDYGTSERGPLPRVTPSKIGDLVLPFRCPCCRSLLWQFSDTKTREDYHDTREGRDNHWCPRCGLRFLLNLEGMPLPPDAQLKAGAAPSKVESSEGTTIQDDKHHITDVSYLVGTDVLGCC